MRARTKQLEAGLIANLHAPACQERHAAAKVAELGALGKVQLGARQTHLVVEVMDVRVLPFADVTMLELLGYTVRGRFTVDVLLFEALGGKDIRLVEDGLLSKRPDACFGARRLVLPDTPRLAITRRGLGHAPPLRAVGAVDQRHRLKQALTVLGRHSLQHRPIRRDRFE